jgi:hypothetical protein
MKRTVALAAGILLSAGTALPAPATSSGFDRGNAAIVVAPVHPCFGPRFFGRSVRPVFVTGRPLIFGRRLLFQPQLPHRAQFFAPKQFLAPCTQLNCVPRTSATAVLTDPEATTIVTPPPTMKRCVFRADKWTCERIPARSVVVVGR